MGVGEKAGPIPCVECGEPTTFRVNLEACQMEVLCTVAECSGSTDPGFVYRLEVTDEDRKPTT